MLPNPVDVIAASMHFSLGAEGHRCARERSGAIRCWGANHAGQLGHPAGESITANQSRPVKLPKP